MRSLPTILKPALPFPLSLCARLQQLGNRNKETQRRSTRQQNPLTKRNASHRSIGLLPYDPTGGCGSVDVSDAIALAQVKAALIYHSYGRKSARSFILLHFSVNYVARGWRTSTTRQQDDTARK
jgi:hypothetical protein